MCCVQSNSAHIQDLPSLITSFCSIISNNTLQTTPTSLPACLKSAIFLTALFFLLRDFWVSSISSFGGFCQRLFESFGDLLMNRRHDATSESNPSLLPVPGKSAEVRREEGTEQPLCACWLAQPPPPDGAFHGNCGCMRFGWVLKAIFGKFKNLHGVTFILVKGLDWHLLKK